MSWLGGRGSNDNYEAYDQELGINRTPQFLSDKDWEEIKKKHEKRIDDIIINEMGKLMKNELDSKK